MPAQKDRARTDRLPNGGWAGRFNHPLDTLEYEHQVILAVVEAMEREVEDLAAGGPLRPGFWLRAAGFIENFAGLYHHAREEDLLFPVLQECGLSEKRGPIAVLKHEHVECRALKECLRRGVETNNRDEVLRSVRAYNYLLRQHIEKEERVLFQVARQLLTTEQVEQIVERFARVEQQIMGQDVHREYVDLARQLCAETGVQFKGPTGP